MLLNNNEYLSVVSNIKDKIKSAQRKVVLQANAELLTLYWNIGCIINNNKTWGSKFIENLAKDIKLEFPEITGYSVRNLSYMAKFATTYPEIEYVQNTLAQITWSHNLILLDKVKDQKQKEWYALKTVENGWSVNVLIHQIESELYQRQVVTSKITNFDKQLVNPQNELAKEMIKDPYIFDFIPIREDMKERDIEQELVQRITSLLLELGTGFAFLGNQYHLEIGGKDFYLDMLFYNMKLRCYVVIELKTGDFQPEYAGKLNFYLSAVDDLVKGEQDNSSIGILLCKSKNDIIAEYALRDMTKPIGVSQYEVTVTENLPKELKDTLPSAEDFKNRIGLE